MSSFNAGTIIEPLDYDFSKYKAGKGVIKEPDDDQIMAFGRAIIAHQRRLQKLYPDVSDTATTDEQLDALEKFSSDLNAADVARQEAEIYSALCSGHPSADDLMKLPRRHRAAFYRWLNSEVVNPEAAADGGSAQLLTQASATSA